MSEAAGKLKGLALDLLAVANALQEEEEAKKQEEEAKAAKRHEPRWRRVWRLFTAAHESRL